MNLYTDIAAEICKSGKQKNIPGIEREHLSCDNIDIIRVKISRDDLGRPRGNYTLLDMPPFELIDDKNSRYMSAVSVEITRLLPAKGLVLVVGLGNEKVTADSLGPRVASKIFVTRQMGDKLEYRNINLRSVASFIPGVEGKTGIKTHETIKCLVEKTRPDAVILVDSLYTNVPERLGSTVQVTDSGLSPRGAKPLTAETLGCHVVAVGVPTLMQSSHGNGQFVVTPRELDNVMSKAANVLSFAINNSVQRSLTQAEINYLVS